ncbi:efflux transporter outer membrane subunit [Saccharibacter sp. 17.LH.SD]|uniref:efflux transporter outer membrane subunit n=1 Tax=Saccharibacter sp. 17.LH.SD TaxID=2689393 RepID=UPI0013716DB5|nr:efflux transporter outer membrane subunit [Saccharibacter sp. 17.LH.SD]MXV43782.1 efflux transporter outer membrane subunit [Saccharibacter sp. 17.LH.SD]
MRRAFLLTISGCLFLTSCMVGPDYKPDHFPVPDHFTSQPHPATKEEIAATEASLKEWWAKFQDPVLNSLVERAIKGNYDLQVASQHILSEQALRRLAQSDWYPQLDANAGGGDSRYSINVDNWPIRPGNPVNHPDASVLTYGARANWELDVFGRIARQVQERKRIVDESIEARRGVLVTLLSQLVGDYIILRTVQERLNVTEDAIRTAHASTQLVERLYTNGVGNTLAIAQARAEEHAEKAQLPPLHAQQERMIHAIAMLMGEMPGTIEPELEKRHPLPKVPTFPATIPSMVLANRPDIREAERHYAASMARIGVAVAQLYPNFSIPLTFNPNASALYQAFQVGGMSWNFMMMMSLPVLHGGKYGAQIAEARSQAEASRLQYRQTVLNAFREVEDGLDDWHQDNETVSQQWAAAKEAGLARERAQKLFTAGLTGYLNVLNSQQTALKVRDDAVRASGQRLNDAVTLYVAMGAGWQGRELTDTRLPIEKKGQSMLMRAFTR